MKITFLGATEEVTGSKYLVEHDNVKILVDCGLFQGSKELKKRNWDQFPIDPKSIDALVITHAHIDHTGYIPVLVKRGFRGKIYCSNATFALCSIMLLDCGLLQEEDAKRANKHHYSSHVPALPLYTLDDAKHALTLFHAIEYDLAVHFGKSLSITLIRSGHILGSSFVVVSDGVKKLTFSGDLGRPQDLMLKPPPPIEYTDYLVIESTYGDRVHSEEDPIRSLGEVVRAAVAKGGNVIIPAFAVGRTQTVLYGLYMLKQNKLIPNVPIVLDSPMAISVSDLFCKFKDEHTIVSDMCEDIFADVIYTRTVEESKRIHHQTQPMIIIAGSGMADGGRVVHHVKYYISDQKNTILFIGFQAVGTLGRMLLEGKKEIKIHGEMYPVAAAIKKINALSAHADNHEIIDWLSHFENRPQKVFVTHGELRAAQALKKSIEERFGWSVVIPKYLESFEIS